MKRVVLDASPVVAWLLKEERPDWVDSFIRDAQAGEVVAAVPSLFWLEIGNRLARFRDMNDEQAIDGMLRAESLRLEHVSDARHLRLLSLQLARQNTLTMYDATYLAIASVMGIPIVTLDRALDRAAARSGLSFQRGTRRLAEAPASYGIAPDPVSLSSIGSALSQLRGQYSKA